MTILKSSLVLLLFVAISCNSTKNSTATSTSTSSNQNAETMNNSKMMMEDGYKMGTIVASKAEGDCPFTIRIEDGNPPYLLDPQNLENMYKKEGEKVWVKFRGLRMMNRCTNANPIEITTIQKRK